MPTEFCDLLRPFLRFAGDGPIEPGTDLRQAGLDSMQAIELLFAVEDEFGVTLDDDAMTDTTFATAGSLWDALSAGQAAGV